MMKGANRFLDPHGTRDAVISAISATYGQEPQKSAESSPLPRRYPPATSPLHTIHYTWDHEAYRSYYDERSAIRQYDGGLSQDEAERLGFEDCISQWLNQNLADPCPKDICCHCGGATGEVGVDSIPILRGTKGDHLWVHHDCYQEWRQVRKQTAREALSSIIKEKRVAP